MIEDCKIIKNACTQTMRYKFYKHEYDKFGGDEVRKYSKIYDCHLELYIFSAQIVYTNFKTFGETIEINDTSQLVDILSFEMFDVTTKHRQVVYLKSEWDEFEFLVNYLNFILTKDLRYIVSSYIFLH